METSNLLLLMLFAAVYTLQLSTAMRECIASEELCVPLKSCPKYAAAFSKGLHRTNETIKNDLFGRVCKTKHICCRKKDIRCKLNDLRGVCLLREQCPSLKQTNERKWRKLKTEAFCHTDDEKQYFCCTDPQCVAHRQFCDSSPKEPAVARPPSAYKPCQHKGKPGLEVPKQLCMFEHTIIDKKTVCCPRQVPDRPLNGRAAHLAKMQCGTPSMSSYNIFNGQETQRGEYPWMAFLLYKSLRPYRCSGTLIHEQYVLTASHCAIPQLYAVRLGVYDVKNTPEPQDINVKAKIQNGLYDVALLRLVRRAEIGPLVQPICLPLFANVLMHVPKILTITGWGLTDSKNPSNRLMKGSTTVVPLGTKGCADHEICIGGKRAESNQCNGDSGGPYQALSEFNGSSRYVQYGVISHGASRCSDATNTNNGVLVAYVLDWILNNMDL